MGQDHLHAPHHADSLTPSNDGAVPGKKSRSEQLPVQKHAPAGVAATPAASSGDPDAVYRLHLDATPRASGGTPVVQRKPLDYESRDGEIALQRVLATGTLDDVTRAIAALKKARGERSTEDPDPSTPRVEQTTEPDVVDLKVDGVASTFLIAPRATDSMLRVLSTRLGELLGMQPDKKWVAFAAAFNREFATILNAFDLVDDAKDGARNDVVAIRLQYLFTDGQRELLMGFFADNLIPDGLFNGDERGHTTAQQRILMASHMLATGKYLQGSVVQQVHALACFHWVRIVHHYAGATSTGLGKSMTGNFDHGGNTVLATARTESVDHANRDDSLEIPEGSSQDRANGDKAYRFGNVPWSTVMTMEPGDWLYIYNANKSISGAHSVIFGGWVGDEGTDAGRFYREARIFDQGDPDQGGRSRTQLLGSDIFMHDGRAVNPVNQITRVNADAMPADTVAALTPDITRKVAKHNEDFIRKLGWKKANAKKTFDVGAMNAWLRAENAAHIANLIGDGRLTDGQRALLEEANASDDNHTLVCLYQRVVELSANSDALQRNEDKTNSTNTATLDAAEAAQQARTDEVVAKVGPLAMELEAVVAQLEPLEAAYEALDLSDEVKEARTTWRRLRTERKALPPGEARDAKRAEEDAMGECVALLEAQQKVHKSDVKDLAKAIKALEADERRLDGKITKLWSKLEKDDPTAAIFALTHGGSRKDTLKETVNGDYADLPGDVKWNTFMTEEEVGPG